MAKNRLTHRTLRRIGAVVALAVMMMTAAAPLSVQAAAPCEWHFNTDGDTEGWQCANGTVAAAGGFLKFTSNKTSDDVKVIQSDILFTASDYTTLKIGIRLSDALLQSNDGGYNGWGVYFKTSSEPDEYQKIISYNDQYVGYRTPRYDIPTGAQNGDVIEVTIDLTEHEKWKDTITYLRFDPFNLTEDFEIDYIVLNNGESVQSTNGTTSPDTSDPALALGAACLIAAAGAALASRKTRRKPFDIL